MAEKPGIPLGTAKTRIRTTLLELPDLIGSAPSEAAVAAREATTPSRSSSPARAGAGADRDVALAAAQTDAARRGRGAGRGLP